MADPVATRHHEQAALVEVARSYVASLSERVPLVAAALAGSVARGDFNVWSDIDVVVVAEPLPTRAPERATLLVADAPPRVQAVGFTPDEFLRALAAGNPLAREAVDIGVVLAGAEFFRQIEPAEHRRC